MSIAFRASRYGKSLDQHRTITSTAHSTSEQYEAFVTAVLEAESYEPHIRRRPDAFFEGCFRLKSLPGAAATLCASAP